MRLLLVEDDEMMGQAVKIALSQAGHAVDWARNSEDAEEVLRTTTYDTVVLDINLPGRSGIDLLKSMRKWPNNTPVLALTARDTTKQKIEGLNAGADDYLVKPFDLEELLARLHSLHRRSNGRTSQILERGTIACDVTAKTVSNHGKPVSLSAKEFAVLTILLENAGRIINKSQIEDKLYGWDFEVESNAVEVHISGLRKKLGGSTIKTIRGLGYIVE